MQQTMLRGKHLGTLSHSARSFFLNGPKGSAGDGSSCTCSEDETCTSRRPLMTNVQNAQNSSSVSSKGVGILTLINAGKEVDARKPENCSLSQEIPTSSSHAISYADLFSEKDMVHSSPPLTDQLVKAGMVTSGILSDLVSYKFQKIDSNVMQTSSQSSMVGRKKPVSSTVSANAKASRGENIYGKSSAKTESQWKLKSVSNGAKGTACKSVLDKAVKSVPMDGSGTFVETPGISSEPRDRKRYITQRSDTYANQFTPSSQQSDGNFSGSMSEGLPRPLGDVKLIKVAPASRKFMNSSHTVENVSRILLQQFNWSPATEEALRKVNSSLDAYQANQILKQLRDYKVALSFFYWLKRQPGFKHDGHTYTTMIGVLGHAKQFQAINRLLDQMVDDGCQPNTVTYNRLIHSYGRANYLNDALGVFSHMQKVGCKPDRVTYCTLIDIHAKAGYIDVAIDMYHRMQEAGLSPDTFTYSVIINCLGKAGDMASADKLFCEMVNQGCVPNLVTYNIMITLYAKARNYQSAIQLYRDMQRFGFEPDKVTYSIVMEVLGHCGYLNEAEAVFWGMKRKNWVPDEPVYGLLVDLWGKAGNAEKACEWYQAMLNSGLCPNVPTCNSLLGAFLRARRLPDAHNLLRGMLDLGLHPSLQTYTLLLSCCTEAQTPLDMSLCCELMNVSGHPAHIFLLSMPAPGPSGQNIRAHVSNFLDMMHSEDRESKRGLMDAVINFFHKTGLKEEAGSVWEVATQKNVYPDAVREKHSRYWLINLHVMSAGTAVTALSRTLAWFRREMLRSGICLSRIDIATGWGRRSRVTGSSLVRQTVQELLNMFDFPFHNENSNSGCFVGCGEPLNQWLLQSYVERMHLL